MPNDDDDHNPDTLREVVPGLPREDGYKTARAARHWPRCRKTGICRGEPRCVMRDCELFCICSSVLTH